MAVATVPTQTASLERLMSRVARALAVVVAASCVIVLVGYALHVDALVLVRPEWSAMSPLTAVALLCLAVSIACDDGRNSRICWVPILVGAYALVSGIAVLRESLSGAIAANVFGFDSSRAGQTSVPTATSLLALGVAGVVRSREKLADRLAAVAVTVATFAVLDELYETGTLRTLALFSRMSPQTAAAILALGLASLTIRPHAGWASVVASSGTGGASARRLIAFTLLPPLLGFLLARTAELHRLNFGAAMAALVVLTVAPLALLVLRTGRILDELDRERDATAAVEAAREGELRLIADALPALISLVDTNLVYRFANRSYEVWLGLKPEEVIGRTMGDILDTQAMATRRPYLDAALSGQETRFEMLWTLPDGSTRDAEARYLPRFGPDGAVEGLFLFVADITDRKAAERRLVATNVALEERVEARTRERDQIWQISKDMLCIATQDGYLVNLNPAWSDTLGWSLEQLMSEPFISFVHPDDIETTNQAAAKLARGEPALDFENRYRHADGGWRWLSWNAVPDGALIYAIVRDVSEAKAATERERSLEEALRQAQKMEAVGQLTGGLAHDFNNLLTGITGSLDMMSRRVEQGRTGELARYVDAAQAAAKRAAALTHRLLAFSRRQTLDPKPTDVDALVAGLEELVRRTVGPQIAVEIAAAAGVWSVLVDPNQLENALLNLCINARDAMPDGGRLVISTTNLMLDEDRARTHELQPGAYVALGVSDTGTGMAPDVIERIFDPFFTTKPIGQGTGLGLSMIYGFARQSGGQVMVESQLERGTTMTLLLPRWFGRSEHAAAPAEAKAVATDGGESVLVVDDEPTVRMLLVDVLGDLGYRTMVAADGPAGLEILRSGTAVDLLVTDIGLPSGMNGRQLADAGRALRAGLRVLFITGYAEAAVLGDAPLEPGMRVLPKPFAMEALGAMVKEMLAAG